MARILLKFVLSASFILLLGQIASTQSRKPPVLCSDALTTVEMRECAGKEYQKADALLNKTYSLVITKFEDTGQRAALKTAQQAWIKFRDANCEAASYLNRGGTVYPIVYTGCLTQMTSNRTQELQEMLKED